MERRVERIDNDMLDSSRGFNGVYITLTAAVPTYRMKPTDHLVVATTAEADNTAIVYLPSIAEATGKLYFISAPTGSGAGDISVYEKETGAELTTSGDLDADNDFVLLISDGVAWRTIVKA